MEFLADLASWLSPSHLLEDPSSVESAAYIDIAVLLGLMTLLGVLLASRAGPFSNGNALHEQILRRYAGWLAWLSGAGVFAAVVRYANAPFFSKRIWLVIDIIAILALAGHFAWYRFARYRNDVNLYEEARRLRRFHPVPQVRPRKGRSARRRR